MDEQVPRSEAALTGWDPSVVTGEVESIRRSPAIGELIEALTKAQLAYTAVKKDAENPAYMRNGKASKYATLDSVISATRDALARNGLAIIALPHELAEDKRLRITSILAHVSDQFIESTLTMSAVDRVTPQEVGKIITYARRYQWSSLTGIAPEDDEDANNSSGVGSKEAAQAVGKAKIEAKLGPDDGTLSFTPDESGMTHLSGISGIATLRANLTEEQKADLHFVWTGKDWAVPHDSVQDVVRFCTELKIPTKLVPTPMESELRFQQIKRETAATPTTAPKIFSCERKTTRKQQPYLVVRWGSEDVSMTLNCFDQSMFAYIEHGVGKEAVFTITEKGNYKNITGIERIGEQTFSLNQENHWMPDKQVTDADLPKEMFP